MRNLIHFENRISRLDKRPDGTEFENPDSTELGLVLTVLVMAFPVVAAGSFVYWFISLLTP